MGETPRRGVIYIATGPDRFREHAAVSATSLKEVMPGIRIDLYTDKVPPEHPFDEVHLIDASGDAHRDKVRVFRESPFTDTLFLDVDTYVARDLEPVFALLDRFDLAAAHAPIRVAVQLPDVPDTFPEFNTGVIAWRQSPRMTSFFERWLSAYDEIASSRDQPSFRRALFESNELRLVTLPTEYNFRYKIGGYVNTPVAVLHGYSDPTHYPRIASRLNAGVNGDTFGAKRALIGDALVRKRRGYVSVSLDVAAERNGERVLTPSGRLVRSLPLRLEARRTTKRAVRLGRRVLGRAKRSARVARRRLRTSSAISRVSSTRQPADVPLEEARLPGDATVPRRVLSGEIPFHELVSRAQACLPAAGSDEHLVLAYHPLADNNPYQRMLYGRCLHHGIVAVPVRRAPELLNLATVAQGQPVAHLHWTQHVLRGARTLSEAEDRAQAWLATLQDLQHAGVRLLWTIHNVVPHDAAFVEVERSICREMADVVDVMHVLSPSTIDAVAPHYELDPVRTIVVPHSGFVGVYPEIVSQEQARFELGFSAHDTLLAMVGNIRPYKGLSRLLDVFEQAAADDPTFRLLVAGRVFGTAVSSELAARCEANPRIRTHLSRLSDGDLAVFLSASDVVVLPYAELLNSSVLLLAASFGRPVIAPNRGAARDHAGQSWLVTYEPDDPQSLSTALRRAVDLRSEACRSEARAAARLLPSEMSDMFCREVRGRLLGSGLRPTVEATQA